jgi:hypothetical protein
VPINVIQANGVAPKGLHRKPPAKVVEMYPSLAKPPREHLIPFAARIPLSMIDELTAVCSQRKIDKSALVRDFIASGLRSLRTVADHG